MVNQSATIPTELSSASAATDEIRTSAAVPESHETASVVEAIAQTPAATTPDVTLEEPIAYLDANEGWTLANYILFFGIAVGLGALLWYLGGKHLVARIVEGRRVAKGKYRKVGEEDAEKGSHLED